MTKQPDQDDKGDRTSKGIWVNVPTDVYDAWSAWCETRSFVQRKLLGSLLTWLMRQPAEQRWALLAMLHEENDSAIDRMVIEQLQKRAKKPTRRFRAGGSKAEETA